MASQAERRSIECEHLGPWLISRGILMGRTCWHPENLAADGFPHLFSKSCEEWGKDCPLRRKKREVN